MRRLDREAMQGRVQTVLGLVDPTELGPTLMHEHLIWDIAPRNQAGTDPGPEPALDTVWRMNYGTLRIPGNLRQRDPAVAASEVRLMLEAGGRSIVELTIGGLRPDPENLAAVARETGAGIVMGCGHYVESYQDPANRERSTDDFAREMVSQVQEGAWGTGVRAGIIGEIGCSSPWTELERRVMAGAVLAQQETGAALTVHPGREADQPQEIVDFVRGMGGDLKRLVLDHIDRTVFDDERLFRLADSGATLEWDLFGQEASYYAHADIDMPNDAMRLRAIRRLIERGHLEQIVISHDICHRSRLVRFGGHGYRHIFDNVVPLMRRRDFTEDEVEAILVRNPRRLLTFN